MHGTTVKISGNYLSTFRDNLLIPSSWFKNPKSCIVWCTVIYYEFYCMWWGRQFQLVPLK